MFRAFINVFRVPDLRKKVLFTLLMLSVLPNRFLRAAAGRKPG